MCVSVVVGEGGEGRGGQEGRRGEERRQRELLDDRQTARERVAKRAAGVRKDSCALCERGRER